MIRKIFLFALVAFAMYSCSDKQDVTMSLVNVVDEIDTHQNLEFSLSEDIFPDTIQQKWVQGSFLNFTPKIDGKYKFISGRDFIFSPDNGFAPSTPYKVSFKDLPGAKGKEIKFKTKKFHTHWLNLDKANSSYIHNDREQLLISGELVFNYVVNPTDLEDKLEIYIGDDKVKYSLKENTNTNLIHYVIDDFDHETDQDAEVKIFIRKGFKNIGSKEGLNKDIEKKTTLAGKAQFVITQSYAKMDQARPYITVTCSQGIYQNESAIKKLIRIEPKIDYVLYKQVTGFKIVGDFEDGGTYKLTIDSDLKGTFGLTLREDYVQNLSFGRKEPYLKMEEEGAMYLSSRGSKSIAMTIINVPELEVEIFKVFENNIIQYFRNGKDWDWQYIDGSYHEFREYPLDKKLGKRIYKDKIYTSTLEGSGNRKLLTLDPEKMNMQDKFNGFYLIKVSDVDKGWIRQVKLISLSDIGLICKMGKNKIHVFANSIKDATPLQGVNVSFISTNNQEVHTAVTDHNGVVVLENPDKKFPGFQVGMVTAELNKDFNFMLLDKNRVATSRYDVGGKHLNNLDYDVYIYGDRNLYRPGDSVFVNMILRDKSWKTVGEMPVKVKVLTPQGKIYKEFLKTLNKQGAADFALHIPTNAITGKYQFEVYSGSDVLLKSYSFLVEEFMPDRIKVTSKMDEEIYNSQDSLFVSINAMNLYGTPASNKNVEVELSLKRKDISFPKLHPEFNFRLSHKSYSYIDGQTSLGKTDDEGDYRAEFKIPDFSKNGVLQGTVYSTVFDETGRPVARSNSFEVLTQQTFYGIKYFDRYVDTKKLLQIPVVAVDRKGKHVSKATARVNIIHYTWETVLERSGSGYRYRSQKKETLVHSDYVQFQGKTAYIKYNPVKSGSYEIKIFDQGSESYVSKRFYAYGWGDTDYTSFEVDKEGEVIIEFDKDKYEVGEDAEVFFKAPFEGKLLVTVEKDNVEQYYYLKTDKKVAHLEIPILDNFLPNMFVSATLFRGMDGQGVPLTVAHGYKGVKVDDPTHKIDVEIIADEKSRSSRKQKVKVKTKPGAELTIAVIDEGILQVGAYQTPDPYEYFYQPRALNVETFDFYKLLLKEQILKSSSAAGGAAFAANRKNPLTNKRIKLLAKWSGVITADRRGEGEFEFDLPKFSGAVRIMVVAYDGDKFGSSESKMIIADPLIISMALPRFTSPGDKVDMNIAFTNMMGDKEDMLVKVSTEGQASLTGEAIKDVTIKAGEEKNLKFPVKMANSQGYAKIRVEAEFNDEIFEDKVELTVRPASGLMKLGGSGVITAGEVDTIDTDTEFLDGSVKTEFCVSSDPLVQFNGQLENLISYPHGCLEQTTSKAFPQLVLRDYIMKAGINLENGTPDYHVQEAINKIQNQQTYSGGFSYWAGSYNPQYWTSVYATHFLIEAKRAGFEVRESVVKKAIDYIRKESKSKNYIYYEINGENGRYEKKSLISRADVYAQFVLALYGKPDNSMLNYLKNKTNKLTIDSKYLLASAFMIKGDQNSAATVLPKEYVTMNERRSWSVTFGSDIRNKAISLYALIKSDPDNLQIPVLMNSLQRQFENKRWFSTQEKVYFFMAMAEWDKQYGTSDAELELVVDGKSIFKAQAGEMAKTTTSFYGDEVLIKTKGQGKVFYYYGIEGIPVKNQSGTEDVNLKVRKRYLTRDGVALNSNTFKQNDLVVVELALSCKDGSYVDNVVLTDLLPACFEIDNPRLYKSRSYEWMKDSGHFDYMDVRDDRINFYLTAKPQTSYYYYMVRVVSPGEYVVGPVSADAMYDNNYRSYSGGGMVEVK